MQSSKYRIVVLVSLCTFFCAIMVFKRGLLPFLVPLVFAHCDTMGGPVIQAAKKALETGDLKTVLIWVQKKDEDEIKKAFEKTLAVRKLNPQAKELADMYFFETLVRIHRAREGAPFTGLKPDDTISPVVSAADEALESGSVDSFLSEVSNAVAAGIRQRFNHAIETKKHMHESVEAGREYVRAYVEYVHYVERLHLDATGRSAHHGETEEREAEAKHKH